MTDAGATSVHATAVLVGNRAVLIRGPSGAGKSRLAFDLILAGRAGQIPEAVLVGDDRVHLDTCDGQLVVRPVRQLAGLIEIRGLGIRRCAFAKEAILGLVIDLSAEDAERLPAPESAEYLGIAVPLLGLDPFTASAAAQVRLAVRTPGRGIIPPQ